MGALTALDVAALGVFLASWFGYRHFADHLRAERSLMGVTAAHRIRWMEEMLGRENRIFDSTLVNGISRAVLFFAQTSLFILAGLIGVLGAGEGTATLIGELPLAAANAGRTWHAKVGLEIGIFVFAFFKFTWSMRQFNYLMILMGATPPRGTADAAERGRDMVARAARLSDLATQHFNIGIRAYYFGLAALAWFVHPLLFAGASLLVVLVLWRREFRSRALKALRE